MKTHLKNYMNLEKITAVLEAPTKQAIQELLQDEAIVFWVDWREDDDAIVEYCQAVLQPDGLSVELFEVESRSDFGTTCYHLYG